MKTKKIQLARHLTQLVFVGLLLGGLYTNIRMVLMVFLPASFLFGNFFCGWACPYGSIQEFMAKIGKKLFKKQYKMPRKIQKYLQYSRYVLFIIASIGLVAFIMKPLNGYGTFLGLFFDGLMDAASVTALVIMGIYVVLSIVFERPFCNYFCTEGVKYGVVSMTRIFSFKRNTDTCINCKKCDKACPMNIEISSHDYVRNGQCINCFECVSACPVKGTLDYKKVGLNLKKKNRSMKNETKI